jgi:hypothetical protein
MKLEISCLPPRYVSCFQSFFSVCFILCRDTVSIYSSVSFALTSSSSMVNPSSLLSVNLTVSSLASWFQQAIAFASVRFSTSNVQTLLRIICLILQHQDQLPSVSIFLRLLQSFFFCCPVVIIQVCFVNSPTVCFFLCTHVVINVDSLPTFPTRN